MYCGNIRYMKKLNKSNKLNNRNILHTRTPSVRKCSLWLVLIESWRYTINTNVHTKSFWCGVIFSSSSHLIIVKFVNWLVCICAHVKPSFTNIVRCCLNKSIWNQYNNWISFTSFFLYLNIFYKYGKCV